MRKFLVGLIAVFFFLTGVAVAQTAATTEKTSALKDKLVVGVEYDYGKKDVNDVNLVSLNLGSRISAGLSLQASNVRLSQYLTTVGYKLSDNLTPYVILGYSNLDMDQSIVGSLKIGRRGGSATLTDSEYRDGTFTYGGGAKGKLVSVKGIDLGYDVRAFTFSNSAKNESFNVLGVSADDRQKVDYTEADLALIASKDFAVSKVVKSVTPYVGYQFSRVDITKKDDISIGRITASSENNMIGNINSALVGVSTKITDNWSAKIGAVINRSTGVQVAAAYNF